MIRTVAPGRPPLGPPCGASRRLEPTPPGASRPHLGTLTSDWAIYIVHSHALHMNIYIPTWGTHAGPACPHLGPHREAPGRPQGGGPWGYRVTHMSEVRAHAAASATGATARTTPLTTSRGTCMCENITRGTTPPRPATTPVTSAHRAQPRFSWWIECSFFLFFLLVPVALLYLYICVSMICTLVCL